MVLIINGPQQQQRLAVHQASRRVADSLTRERHVGSFEDRVGGVAPEKLSFVHRPFFPPPAGS